MATTSINRDQASRFASAVAPRSAPIPATDAAGFERFSIPAGESHPAPASRRALEPKTATRERDAAKTGVATSVASPTAEPSSPRPKGDAARPGALSQRSAYRGPVQVDAGGVGAAEAALREQDPVSGQIEDLAETRPLRARRDEDQATPPNEAGLGGSPVQRDASAAKGTNMHPTLPQQGGDPSSMAASGFPQPAGKAGLPMTGGAGPLSASSVQAGHETPQSAAPPQAGNALPPSMAGQSAIPVPVQAIASAAIAAEAVTATEERNDDVEVPADGAVADPTATAMSALAPPELLAPPPPANAPAMAVQAGAASSPKPSAIVAPGAGGAQAAAGRPVAVPVSGTDRPASSERETSSAKAFDELAPGSTVAADDLASAPTATFSPVPAAHIPAPAPDPAGAFPQAQAAPVPLGAVPMTIGLRSLAGSNRFEISLDPKDLGRIDVNLDIDKDSGTVTAHLTVDRPETLALLQRDVGNLQQALSQAGFDAGEAAINLSLRSDTGSDGGNGAERDGGGGRDGRSGTPGSDLKDPRLSNDVVPLRMLRGLGGIDIRI
ncbi:flagellar hook-length control protein FliK [Methylobacterium bullatum]|uniref:Flagellar hook-length control protein-like C-terminal domain-containing protein n=1 Tax=Methylobacterium bullatum TaxID=570505 RepID=A0A679JPW9_9HYPH|nr:hypothetical protein MBLL_01777 [Methylobacterium bullatum]